MNSDRRSDRPLNKSSLQGRRTTPPPPPKRTSLDPQDKNPLDSASTRSEPPKPPGTHARKQRNKRDKLLVRSLKVFFFFFSPLGIIAAVWAFLFTGDDDKPTTSSPPVTVAPTTAPETSTSTPTTSTAIASANQALPIRSVVYIESDCPDGFIYTGSGTIIGNGQQILTNAHVVSDESGNDCKPYIWFTSADGTINSQSPDAQGKINAIDAIYDLALLEVQDSSGTPITTEDHGHPAINLEIIEPSLGEDVFILGYPGGLEFNITKGIYSGFTFIYDEIGYYKTDAVINRGNSGGAAFDSLGNFIGVPTAATGVIIDCTSDECDADIPLGLIRPVDTYVMNFVEAAE